MHEANDNADVHETNENLDQTDPCDIDGIEDNSDGSVLVPVRTIQRRSLL
jgi:hypothetical protein